MGNPEKDQMRKNKRVFVNDSTSVNSSSKVIHLVRVVIHQPKIRIKFSGLLGKNMMHSQQSEKCTGENGKRRARNGKFLSKAISSIISNACVGKKKTEECMEDRDVQVHAANDVLHVNGTSLRDQRMPVKSHLNAIDGATKRANGNRGMIRKVLGGARKHVNVSSRITGFLSRGVVLNFSNWRISKSKVSSKGNAQNVVGERTVSGHWVLPMGGRKKRELHAGGRIPSYKRTRSNGIRRYEMMKKQREHEELGHQGNGIENKEGELELCKKRILMGEKCRPLNSSGFLHYDKDGILLPEEIPM